MLYAMAVFNEQFGPGNAYHTHLQSDYYRHLGGILGTSVSYNAVEHMIGTLRAAEAEARRRTGERTERIVSVNWGLLRTRFTAQLGKHSKSLIPVLSILAVLEGLVIIFLGLRNGAASASDIVGLAVAILIGGAPLVSSYIQKKLTTTFTILMVLLAITVLMLILYYTSMAKWLARVAQ